MSTELKISKKDIEDPTEAILLETAVNNVLFAETLLSKNPHLATTLANSESGFVKLTGRLGTWLDKLSDDPPHFLVLTQTGLCHLVEAERSKGIFKINSETLGQDGSKGIMWEVAKLNETRIEEALLNLLNTSAMRL